MKYYEALKECIENGKKITRSDWNGKGQYVYYVPPHIIKADDWVLSPGVANELTDHERLTGEVLLSNHFDMVNAQGMRIIGWLATQTDMASDKWVVVE